MLRTELRRDVSRGTFDARMEARLGVFFRARSVHTSIVILDDSSSSSSSPNWKMFAILAAGAWLIALLVVAVVMSRRGCLARPQLRIFPSQSESSKSLDSVAKETTVEEEEKVRHSPRGLPRRLPPLKKL